MKGTIHRLYKAFGYILFNGLEYYFTPKNLGEMTWDQLKIGQEVDFEEIRDPGGIRASEVQISSPVIIK
jgi:hypothetical protein